MGKSAVEGLAILPFSGLDSAGESDLATEVEEPCRTKWNALPSERGAYSA